MSYYWCPRCQKDIYTDKLLLGRVLNRDKNNDGEVEGLCPKCHLFIGTPLILDIEKLRLNAPKNYKHEFKEWKPKRRS